MEERKALESCFYNIYFQATIVKSVQRTTSFGIAMRSIDRLGNWILVIMATASLISIIAAFIADQIVTHNLYSYGLQFNSGWAIPYWNTISIVFAMGCFNIVIVILFQIYRIKTIRNEERQDAYEQFRNELKLEYE